MEGLQEELEFELEALKATYGDDAVHVEPASSAAGGGESNSGGASPPVAVVSLPVGPRCEAEHEQFVAGRLVMTVGAGYPADPPAVQLADAKGENGWWQAVWRALLTCRCLCRRHQRCCCCCCCCLRALHASPTRGACTALPWLEHGSKGVLCRLKQSVT